MSYSQTFADSLLDMMEGLGRVTAKKMFGALGFYHGPTIFACLMDGDVFYLKATSAFADELKAIGGQPFVYRHKTGRQVAMPYVTAPKTCLDDPDEMVKWCQKAISAAKATSKAQFAKRGR